VSRAEVLAYPSVYEGFGFPPLEAMRAGVPVVATAVPAVAEVAGDAAALVPSGDAAALAAAVQAVLDDEHQRDRLVAAGRRRAAGFTWEACAAGLAALYRDAADAR
jgi:glycosyltransferase involved in cell wall biosynthesis